MLTEPTLNIHATGQSASGKTVTGLKFKRLLEIQGNRVIYFVANRSMISSFRHAIQKAIDYPLQSRDNPFKILYTHPRKDVFVIIDEFHIIRQHAKITIEFLRLLYESAIENQKQLHLLTIGNIWLNEIRNIITKYDFESVNSRYCDWREIIFHYYRKEEILKIMAQRFDILGVGYNETTLTNMAEKFADLVADTRLALAFAHRACKMSDYMNVTAQNMVDSWEATKSDHWRKHLDALSPHERILILAATEICLRTGKREITTPELYEFYKILVHQSSLHIEPLYEQRLSQLLKEHLVPDWFSFIGESHKRGAQGKTLHYSNNPATLMACFQKYHQVLFAESPEAPLMSTMV